MTFLSKAPPAREPGWLVVLWTLVFIQFRPALLGDSKNPLVFAALLLVTAAILWSRRRIDPLRIERRRGIAFLLIFITSNYFICQGFLISNATPSIMVNSTIAILGPAVCFLLIQDDRSQALILKTFVYFHALLCISAMLTLIAFAATGFDLQAILLATIRGESQDIYTQHSLLFPFTVVWSSIGLAGINFPRFIGIYREPGMAQIFFFTAFFLTYFLDLRWKSWIRRILFFGSFIIFSTAGVLSLAGGMVCLYLFNPERRRRAGFWLVVGGAAMAVLLAAAVFMPEFGILAKAQNFSGGDRLKSLVSSWEDFLQSPVFGQGYYSGFMKDKDGADVGRTFYGILDVLRQIGLAGVLLYLATWWWGALRMGSWPSLCLYMPCFLTLFTQPSYNDVFVWFLLLLDTRNFLDRDFDSTPGTSGELPLESPRLREVPA